MKRPQICWKFFWIHVCAWMQVSELLEFLSAQKVAQDIQGSSDVYDLKIDLIV